MFYSFACLGVRLLLRLLTRCHVEGLENVPASGPLLLVSNHLNLIDPPVLGAWRRPDATAAVGSTTIVRRRSDGRRPWERSVAPAGPASRRVAESPMRSLVSALYVMALGALGCGGRNLPARVDGGPPADGASGDTLLTVDAPGDRPGDAGPDNGAALTVTELRVVFEWEGLAGGRAATAVLVADGDGFLERLRGRHVGRGVPAALAAAAAADLEPAAQPGFCWASTDDYPVFRVELRRSDGARVLLFSDSSCGGARPWNVLGPDGLARQRGDAIPALLLPLLAEIDPAAGWGDYAGRPPPEPGMIHDLTSFVPDQNRGLVELAPYTVWGLAESALGGAVLVGNLRSRVAFPIDILDARLLQNGVQVACLPSGGNGFGVENGEVVVPPAVGIAHGAECGFVCPFAQPATAHTSFAGTVYLRWRPTGGGPEIESQGPVEGTWDAPD